MKNYLSRVFFAIGTILRNIIKLAFGIIGLVFFFSFALITLLLVIFGWYNDIENKKLIWKEFNPMSSITAFINYYN